MLNDGSYFSLSVLGQIQKVILALGDYMGASCHACIGGTNVRNEMQKLQAEAPHIVVGTPGRVFDMLNRRFLCKSSVTCIYIDQWLGLGYEMMVYHLSGLTCHGDAFLTSLIISLSRSTCCDVIVPDLFTYAYN